MIRRKIFLRVLLVIVAVLDVALVIVWALPGDRARVVGRSRHANGSYSVDLVSTAYTLDRVYKSMEGPCSNHAQIRLSNELDDDAIVWLNGVETEILDAQSMDPISDEFFCHSNLTLNSETTSPAAHNASFDEPLHADWRFFTLVPGRLDIRLPDGFGIPLRNGTLLDYFTMALNQNPGEPERRIRMKTRISYEHDKRPLEPLFFKPLLVYQQFEPGAQSTDLLDADLSDALMVDHEGALCVQSVSSEQRGTAPSTFVTLAERDDLLANHPGAACCVINASAVGVVEQFGQENTVHWMVPPGRHVYRTEVTQQMNLPFDTKIHYATGHLHPFGTSLRLVDLDQENTVIEISSQSRSDRLGVVSMSEVSSREGILLRENGRYELIAEYDNTGKAAVDAMGMLLLYVAARQHED